MILRSSFIRPLLASPIGHIQFACSSMQRYVTYMSAKEDASNEATRLSVRQLSTPIEFEQAHDLYRNVFRYNDSSLGINPRLLTTLIENGGTAIGVFTAEPAARLVGFSYGYPGMDPFGQPYHYSQAAVVEPAMQGQGIGRTLKTAQAESALRNGATHMRWSFDPVQARNAHFNLNSLGSRGRWFAPEFYGANGDRMTVEWELTKDNSASSVSSQTLLRPSRSDWGAPINVDGKTFLPIPAQFNELDERSAEIVRAQIRAALAELLASGAIAVACDRIDSVTAMYCLVTEP